ncbi:hypothetical protein HJC23_013600 [Cyclotella cryptica]|uniref:Transmembrane protein n=1 Tax=Cyclotella cryptica TaxID=29204 RepID=A0ABD3PPK2_9STRA|eukprot:CCRYP_012591-RA/>CCRYP_012591-RA protein AED:0.21 eAED:0.21 QI:282/1/1/1/1/1/3/121/1498
MISFRRTPLPCLARLLFLTCSTLSSVASTVDVPFATRETVSNDAKRSRNVPKITDADAPPDCSPSSSSSSTSSRYHALMCWLWNARVTLPQEEFQEEIFTITITDMTCTNFQISHLASSYTLPPSSPHTLTSSALSHPNPTITLQSSLSSTCSGQYHVNSLMSGTVSSTVASSNDKSMHLVVDVAAAPLRDHDEQRRSERNHTSSDDNDEEGELPFPTLATLTTCQTTFLVTDLQFTGGISSKIIELFSGVISNMVTEALNQHVCEVIKKEVEGGLETGMHLVGQYLAKLIYGDGATLEDRAVRTVERRMGEETDGDGFAWMENKAIKPIAVRWDRDMPLLKRIVSGANNFISTHLNQGILLNILQKLSTWQSSYVDCQDCGFFFKGFNGLVKSLTHGSGSLGITIPESMLNFHHNHTFAIPNYGNVTIAARRLKIGGLDNLTSFQFFEPSGDSMLASGISSDTGFNVSILLDLTVKPANEGSFRGDLLNESFEVTFNASNVNFTSESVVEVDAEIYRKLTIGSFIFGSYTMFDSNRNLLHCVLEALTSVVFTNLHARMNLNDMHVVPVLSSLEDDSLEDDIDKLINNVMQMLLLQYPATVTESLAALVHAPVRSTINEALANYIDDSKKYPLHCVNVDIPDKRIAQPLEFDTNGAIVFFNEMVNKDSTIVAINTFIECVQEVMTSANLFSGHFFNVSIGEYNLVFHDLQLENINSVYELGLLRPDMDHFHLSNHIGYGKCDKDGDMTSASFGVNILHDNRGSMGNVIVHTKMTNLKLNAGTELKFDMNWLPQLKVSDLLSHAQCISIPATELSFYGFNASFDMLEVNIDVAVVDGETPKTFTFVTHNSKEFASTMSALLTEGAALLEKKMIKSSNSLLEQGSLICTTPANPQRAHVSKRSTAAAGLWTFLILVAFVVGNAWLFMRGFRNHEVKETEAAGAVPQSTATNERDAGEQQNEPEFTSMTEPLLDDDGLDEVLEVESPPRKFPFASSSSLMFHQSIPPVLKFGFPVILALGLVLFVFSNISIGASVDLIVSKASGQQVSSAINIYSFSLGSTMTEMFEAGVYLLMLLILFCSGVWPYVKLLLLLFAWIASTRRLPPVRREQILYLLDSLGKFSLIDAYVLVLMMVAFRYELDVANAGALNVYVTPKFGFYSFLFATIMSLVSGHVMLFFHRRTLVPRIPVYSGRHESLSRHIFEDKHGRGLVKLTKRFRRTIVITVLVTFILICVGVNLKCFHFTFNGLAGTALGQSRIREFSLVSIGNHIPQSVQDPSSFGIHWIQTCYFFFALVMPLVCLLSLFVLFVYPLTIKQQQKVFVLAEVTNAWSAIEVFVIAIVASLVEIAPFSDSMVGKHCSLLNQILSGWSGGNGDELHHCFGVKSSLDGSSAVLIIGVTLNSLLVSTLHRFAHHAMWERIEREDRPGACEDEAKTVRECCLAHTFVSKLRKTPRFGTFMFDDVSFGPHSEYEIDFNEIVAENEEPDSANFWSEWRKIVSVI